MKKLITAICIGACFQADAQNRICNLADAQLHNLYVFSNNQWHTMKELTGENIGQALFNLIYIQTETAKCEIDNLCMQGKLFGAFIFPNKAEGKTIRICTVEEYRAVLKSKMELIIEEK